MDPTNSIIWTRKSFIGSLVSCRVVKSLWECVRWFGFTLRVDYLVILFPRENADLTIMFIAISPSYCDEKLCSIKHCCLLCHAIFLSDITTANGKRLDPRQISKLARHITTSVHTPSPARTQVKMIIGTVADFLAKLLPS
jgi:hypothetical protein